MPLKTLVKVGNISNLSDARYCAGMGVDMLGFCVAAGREAYITPTLYQEIRGWITGPAAVAELYGLTPHSDVAAVIASYLPDYLELGLHELPLIPTANTIPLIVKLESHDDPAHVYALKDRIAYIQVREADKAVIQSVAGAFPVLVELQSGHTVEDVLAASPVKGLALNGSPEVRPGYKDYGDLADVLEQLEVD